MNKTVIYITSFIAIQSIAGLMSPLSSAYYLFLPSEAASVLSLASLFILIVLILTSYFKGLPSTVFSFIGTIFITFSIIGFLSPTILGLLNSFIAVSDLLLITLTGCSFLIIGLETAEPTISSMGRILKFPLIAPIEAKANLLFYIFAWVYYLHKDVRVSRPLPA